jgi:hypothetical protein
MGSRLVCVFLASFAGAGDISIAEAFERVIKANVAAGRQELVLAYARLQVTTELAADWTTISCLDWEEDEMFGEKPEEMFKEGYDQIPMALAKGLDIRLSHVATSVRYVAGEGCLITCKNVRMCICVCVYVCV